MVNNAREIIEQNSTPAPDTIMYAVEKETLTDGSHVYNVILGIYRIGFARAGEAEQFYRQLDNCAYIDKRLNF
jgi:hypothetical protein